MFALSRIWSSSRALCGAAVLGLSMTSAAVLAGDDQIDLVPNNADVVAEVKVADILESPAFEKITAQFPDLGQKLDEPFGKDTKLTPRDIDSVFVAADTSSQSFVVVITLNDEVKLEDVLSADQRANAETIGDYTLNIVEADKALCLIDEYTIAAGPADTLRAVLKRNGDAKISEQLTTTWDAVGEDQQLYVVATLDSLVQQAAGALPPGLPLSPETLGKLKAISLSANAGEGNIAISADLNCSDNTTADQIRSLLNVVVQSALQPGSNTPAEARETIRSIKSSIDGEFVTIELSIGLDVILGQIKSQLGAIATP